MAIRPLAEGRPSTDGPLQIKSVPSNVNTYVEGDVDAVGLLRWWHLLGAPRFGSVWSLQNHYPRSREHFLTISARRYSYLFGGLGLILRHHQPSAEIE